jgi:SAM-dependent methyltransferase
MEDNLKKSIEERYGAYASFKTNAAPCVTEYYGENPGDEIERLLNIYITPESKLLDLGCGAGFTMSRISSKVADYYGIDCNSELLSYAESRAEELKLSNVTLIHGDTTTKEHVENLPEDSFDIAFSQRGPNMNANVLSKLKVGGYFLQERVSSFDCYPLQEIFGRRNYSPYNYNDSEVLLSEYAEMGLFPISIKEYFYDEFFTDIDHLESYLKQGANLSDWRLAPKPYNAKLDRTSLELYCKYNITEKGIRIMHRRKVFAFRKTCVTYYPIDNSFI